MELTIFLDNQHVFAPIGWGEEERKRGVNLWVTVSVTLNAVPQDDDLKDTLDYSAILNMVLHEATIEHRLLESYAKAIMAAVISAGESKLKSILVTIQKRNLEVPGFNAAAAGVTLQWNV